MIHGVLAAATAVIAGLVVALSAIGAFRRCDVLLWVDRLILAALGGIALSIVVGLGLLVAGNGPADALHLVYGGAALIALPVARFAAPSVEWRRRLVSVAIGALVLIGLTIRLLQTG